MSSAVRDIGPKLAIGLLIGGILVAALVEGRDSVPTGGAAPTFELQRYEGGTVNLAEFKGKLVLVNFWATWCPPCVEEMPYFIRLAQKYEAKGLQFVAVSDDDADTARDDVRKFAEKTGLSLTPFVAFATSDVRRAYGVQALPTTILIAPDGTVVASKRGMASEKWLEEKILEHLPK